MRSGARVLLGALIAFAWAAAAEPDPAAPAPPAAKDSPPAAEDSPPAKQPDSKSPAKNTIPGKKSSGGSSLDDDLFGDLTGDLLDGLDRPKLGPLGQGKPPGSGEQRPPGKDPAAKPDPSAGLDPLAGEDLGQEDDPLLHLGKRMRQSESLISRGNTGDPTQRMQDEIIKDLDALIAAARNTLPSCNSGRSSRPGAKDSAKMAGKNPSKQGTGDFRPNPLAKDSEEGIRKDRIAKPKGAESMSSERALWGLLPKQVQEAIRNAQSSKFLPEYADEVRDYFSRLAELYQEQQP